MSFRHLLALAYAFLAGCVAQGPRSAPAVMAGQMRVPMEFWDMGFMDQSEALLAASASSDSSEQRRPEGRPTTTTNSAN
jgi:hypothetical protein